MKLKVLPVFALLAVILSSCAPALQQADLTQAGTVMQVVYGRIYNGTLDAWAGPSSLGPFLWAVFAFILIGAICTAIGKSMDNVQVGCFTGIVIGLIVAAFVFFPVHSNLVSRIPDMAKNQGISGMKGGLDQAKFDKANVYLEVLHAPVISATIDRLDCKQSTNENSNCYPYEWTFEDNPHDGPCDMWETDSNGDSHCTHYETVWDTEHVGYFRQLSQYRINVALLNKLATTETGLTASDTTDLPYKYLSDHWMVPYDYDNYWASDKRTNLTPADYTPPADWTYYSSRLAACTNQDQEAGHVQSQCAWPVVNVWHRYVNWIFASDEAVFQQYAGDIQRYTNAGLIPDMATIYSRNGGWPADYDFVQFAGGLSVPQDQYYAWQDGAGNFSAYFSNARQGSLDVVFAPKAQVESLGSIDQWADALKAGYSQKGRWNVQVGNEVFQRLMPKNSFIFACEVDGQTISACRIRTAMPEGNEIVTEDFRSGNNPVFTNLAFSPAAFFGNIRISEDTTQAPLAMIQIKHDPASVMDLTLRDDPNGLRRVSMKLFDYLQADIKLSQGDVDNLVASQVQIQQDLATRAWQTPMWFVLGLCVLVGLFTVIGSQE